MRLLDSRKLSYSYSEREPFPGIYGKLLSVRRFCIQLPYGNQDAVARELSEMIFNMIEKKLTLCGFLSQQES